MRYLMTHSLLSSWLYSMKENPFDDATTEDTGREDFLRVLRREPTPTSEAMKNGIDFENLVTDILRGKVAVQETFEGTEPNTGEAMGHKEYPKWYEAAKHVAEIIKGSQLQLVAMEEVTIRGVDLLLYGRLDALHGGNIFDIKFSKSYDRGKYIDSTQHPMYLRIVPGARDFTYVISNGTDVWTEKYRFDEVPRIEPVISDFLEWLEEQGLMETYKEHWKAKR